ncbi:ubiquinone biosynthesis protein COQ4 homolog, mitochondrial-like [Diadema antillarum]|uniref:ubiquinone biosynthesis protein COQ4 homolog, mitochondrial-like n=1 Tax=Diadema antillarum TaxID=105358 RepID=UPI003A8C6469
MNASSVLSSSRSAVLQLKNKRCFAVHKAVWFFGVRRCHERRGNDGYPDETMAKPNMDGLLYEHHTPTTALQKILLTAGSGFMSLYNPYRHDMVAVFGETTGFIALPRLYRLMKEDPVGREILKERPRINHKTVDMQYLAGLPDDTFGKMYYDFMVSNNISADTRAPVRFVDDPDLAYVLQRYREVHDFYHTLLDMPINIMGEVVVKWFEAVQTRLPMCALGAILGPINLSGSERRELLTHYVPAVLQMAPRSKLLLNVYFERHWETPIGELREHMRVYPLRKA